MHFIHFSIAVKFCFFLDFQGEKIKNLYFSNFLKKHSSFSRFVATHSIFNDKFVVYRTMVNISATLKSPCVKACYLIQKLEPVIERMYFPNVLAKFFFHNLINQRYESSKKQVSHRQQISSVVYETLNF